MAEYDEFAQKLYGKTFSELEPQEKEKVLSYAKVGATDDTRIEGAMPISAKDQASTKMFGKPFAWLNPGQQAQVVQSIGTTEKEQTADFEESMKEYGGQKDYVAMAKYNKPYDSLNEIQRKSVDEEIAQSWKAFENIDTPAEQRPDKDYNPNQLKKGQDIETNEHGLTDEQAKNIAKDHIDKNPDEYAGTKEDFDAFDNADGKQAYDEGLKAFSEGNSKCPKCGKHLDEREIDWEKGECRFCNDEEDAYKESLKENFMKFTHKGKLLLKVQLVTAQDQGSIPNIKAQLAIQHNIPQNEIDVEELVSELK